MHKTWGVGAPLELPGGGATHPIDSSGSWATLIPASMSASKLASQIGSTSVVSHFSAVLTLPSNGVRFRKNGIEFQTGTPLPQWSEMTVDLESARGGKKLRCTGVVVACTGNRHSGYSVSLLFTGLSRQTQARLNNLVYS